MTATHPSPDPLTPDEARHLVSDALTSIVPDADPLSLEEGASLREELELDSLDFLTFVERLSRTARVRIDEADYPRLDTLTAAAGLVAERSVAPG
jgi:acyl carrier protein